MNLRGLLIIALGLTVLLMSNTSIHAKEVRGVTDGTIKMGLINALTGPAAGDYLLTYNAIKTYYKYVNDKGGINGRKVKMIVEDDRYVIPAAIAAFKKLVFRDEVLYLHGPSGSPQIVALMRQIQKEKIPSINVAPTVQAIEPYKRYLFIVGSIYRDHQPVVFDYLVNDMKLKNPRIAFVYPDNEYGKTARDAARESAKRFGIKIVTEEVINLGDIAATSVIMNLKRVKPDYVIHQGYVANTIAFFKDSKKFGFKTNYIGTAAAATEAAIKMIKGSGITYYSNHLYGLWYDDNPGTAKTREITLRYNPGTEKEYKKLYTLMYVAGWISSNVCVEGLKRAGRNLNAETFVDALETFRGVDFGGISPPITYTSKSHKPHSYSKMGKADIDKEAFISLTDWRKPLP